MFAKFCNLYIKLTVVIILNDNIWVTIFIIIIFDILYNNFNIITTYISKIYNKIIN